MKGVCDPSADRITDLPAEVIQCILVLLPIKDAARTSLLSRDWRHRWRSIPELVFEDDFADIIEEAKSKWEVMSKQVMLNILECLLFHDGPVTKFELSIPGLLPCREIDLVTRYLSKKGVQHFILEFRCLDDVDVDNYQMHSSLFSALHLKSLTLQCCQFTPPTRSAGFKKLTHLRLDCVILPSDFFDNFLLKCPMLECLLVLHCGVAVDKLEIVAPLLKSFDFGGKMDICFKSTPLLSKVSLHFTDKPKMVATKLDMVSLLASLPRLQQLCVNHAILKYLARGSNVPTRLPTPLHLLEVLYMGDLIFDGSGMERVFLCLIRSSPNLRSLTVQVSWSKRDVRPPNDGVTSIWRLLEAEVRPESSDCLQHLRRFTIKHIYSTITQVELDLVRFILATAPLLRLVHVKPSYELGTKEATEYKKELMQCKRISKDAEIIYGWNLQVSEGLTTLPVSSETK